jgi:RNA polymerase sigma factor (sigma-70 family)
VPTERNRCLHHALAEHASLTRRLRKLVRDTADAADIDDFMQETFVRILQTEFPSESSVGSLNAFVWTIARNVAHDWARSAQRQAGAHTVLGVLEDPSNYGRLDNALQTRQELNALYRAYKSLPRQLRRAVRLRKMRGLSQREIAHEMGLTENTIESYIGEAMDKIEQKLATELDSVERQTVLAWLRRRTSHD